ncbi:transposase (plasmid) [Streptomyces sp. NBC_00250]
MLLVVAVTAANIPDRDAAIGLLGRLRSLHHEITLVWADGGYTGGLVDWAKEKLDLTCRSSSAPTTWRGSWCCRDAGWWSAPSRG